MSILGKYPSLQQGRVKFVPAEAQLSEAETLEDFVRIIRIRENSRAKRALLPELGPDEAVHDHGRNFLRRLRQKILCLQ